MNKILTACVTKDAVDWHTVKPLQGNYKKRTPEQLEKLCALIIKRGIRFPSFVAKLEDGVWGIDTHGRLQAYRELEKRGFEIPPVPAVYIKAKDKNEAKQLLLECDSRYGGISQEGFEEFIQGIEPFEGIEEFLSGLELPGVYGLEREEIELGVEDGDFTLHEELAKKPKLCPNCGFEL